MRARSTPHSRSSALYPACPARTLTTNGFDGANGLVDHGGDLSSFDDAYFAWAGLDALPRALGRHGSWLTAREVLRSGEPLDEALAAVGTALFPVRGSLLVRLPYGTPLNTVDLAALVPVDREDFTYHRGDEPALINNGWDHLAIVPDAADRVVLLPVQRDLFGSLDLHSAVGDRLAFLAETHAPSLYANEHSLGASGLAFAALAAEGYAEVTRASGSGTAVDGQPLTLTSWFDSDLEVDERAAVLTALHLALVRDAGRTPQASTEPT